MVERVLNFPDPQQIFDITFGAMDRGLFAADDLGTGWLVLHQFYCVRRLRGRFLFLVFGMVTIKRASPVRQHASGMMVAE